ncbi:TetR/AcrR family transcriptional regulator [Amycolatopsis silviterrae]|uniref:TetR/AcrR family transcriptional regulator n=1 Tax=Amycolatopsis silviterrae TaxID=1656914 RepID=A0ABW5H7G4_9PSEU
MAATKRQAGSSATRTEARAAESKQSSSQRRQALVEVAAELFAESGFRATTVRQIGEAAGVFSGSLYHHFDSKEAIADEILSTYLDGIVREYKSIVKEHTDPGTALRELVRAAFASLEPHRAAITILQNERSYLAELPRFAYLTKVENEVRRIWVKVLDTGIAQGSFHKDLDTKLTYQFLRDAIWVAVRWFAPSGRLSVDQLADQYLKLVMRGIELDSDEAPRLW